VVAEPVIALVVARDAEKEEEEEVSVVSVVSVVVSVVSVVSGEANAGVVEDLQVEDKEYNINCHRETICYSRREPVLEKPIRVGYMAWLREERRLHLAASA
jgi:hypothetical protein